MRIAQIKAGKVINVIVGDASIIDGVNYIASDTAGIDDTYANGAFTRPAPIISLAQAKIDQAALITAATQATIIGGFSSPALGVANTYPSTTIDQQNINAVSLVGGSLWCADATGKWAFVPHTKVQAAAVQVDMVAWIQAQQAKNATKQAAITSATTAAAVQAIVW